jgi:hypothetical protein
MIDQQVNERPTTRQLRQVRSLRVQLKELLDQHKKLLADERLIHDQWLNWFEQNKQQLGALDELHAQLCGPDWKRRAAR